MLCVDHPTKIKSLSSRYSSTRRAACAAGWLDGAYWLIGFGSAGIMEINTSKLYIAVANDIWAYFRGMIVPMPNLVGTTVQRSCQNFDRREHFTSAFAPKIVLKSVESLQSTLKIWSKSIHGVFELRC